MREKVVTKVVKKWLYKYYFSFIIIIAGRLSF